MDTVFDILTGLGLATAAGIRPFLPGLAAGALAAANFTIDFDGTDFAFLEGPGWLLAIVIALILVTLAERSGDGEEDRGPLSVAILVAGLAIGAGLFAGTLADHSDTWWPGIPAGLIVAGFAWYATRGLFARVRGRLDSEARSALALYVDGSALLVAVLAILLPPLSLVALGFLVWLLLGSRKKEGQKYAGLRILR